MEIFVLTSHFHALKSSAILFFLYRCDAHGRRFAAAWTARAAISTQARLLGIRYRNLPFTLSQQLDTVSSFFALAYGSRVNKISRNKLFVFNGLVSLQGSKLGSDFSWRSSTSSPIDRLPDAAEPTTTSHKRSQVIRLLYAHGARLLNVNLELIGFHVKFVCLYY
jgi:hypothetical protein